MDVRGVIAKALGLHYIDNRDDWPLHCCCGAADLNWMTHREHQADAVLAALEAEGIVLYRECDDCGGSGVCISEGTPWPICKALGLPPDHDQVECPTCAGAGYFPLESLPESEK